MSINHIFAVERHLSQSCAIMAGLVVTHGRCTIIARDFRPFQTLAGSIISQQLSAKAARLSEIVPKFTPEGFLNASVEALRGARLSTQATKPRALRLVFLRRSGARQTRQSRARAINQGKPSLARGRKKRLAGFRPASGP
jgi:3-methyladenine DNA glycosylase/8-oxoguanine DNA glycosylase